MVASYCEKCVIMSSHEEARLAPLACTKWRSDEAYRDFSEIDQHLKPFVNVTIQISDYVHNIAEIFKIYFQNILDHSQATQ